MNNNKELKILAIIPTGFCYGVQISTVEFFSRFPEKVKSHFLLTRWSTGDMEKLLVKNHIPYSFSWLGMFSRKLDWLNMKMTIHAISKLPKLYYDVIRLLRTKNPDILFFSNHHELILLYPILLFTRRKVVCHMHDPPPAIPFQKKTFKFYGKRVNHFISITDSVRKRTIELGCPPDKITTIPMSTAIRAERNDARQNEFCKNANWPDNVFIVGITGQMTLTKGIMDLVQAFKLLHEKNPNTRLVIGGKPIEPFYSELLLKIKEWELQDVIYFPGWLPDVTYFFHNIDAYVLASRHDEGFGMVVAEAMIASVPVVITASGGAMELVEDGKSGFVIEKNNPQQLFERLLQLSTDSKLRQAFAVAGRKRIVENYDIEKSAIAFVKLLESINTN